MQAPWQPQGQPPNPMPGLAQPSGAGGCAAVGSACAVGIAGCGGGGFSEIGKGSSAEEVARRKRQDEMRQALADQVAERERKKKAEEERRRQEDAAEMERIRRETEEEQKKLEAAKEMEKEKQRALTEEQEQAKRAVSSPAGTHQPLGDVPRGRQARRARIGGAQDASQAGPSNDIPAHLTSLQQPEPGPPRRLPAQQPDSSPPPPTHEVPSPRADLFGPPPGRAVSAVDDLFGPPPGGAAPHADLFGGGPPAGAAAPHADLFGPPPGRGGGSKANPFGPPLGQDETGLPPWAAASPPDPQAPDAGWQNRVQTVPTLQQIVGEAKPTAPSNQSGWIVEKQQEMFQLQQQEVERLQQEMERLRKEKDDAKQSLLDMKERQLEEKEREVRKLQKHVQRQILLHGGRPSGAFGALELDAEELPSPQGAAVGGLEVANPAPDGLAAAASPAAELAGVSVWRSKYEDPTPTQQLHHDLLDGSLPQGPAPSAPDAGSCGTRPAEGRREGALGLSSSWRGAPFPWEDPEVEAHGGGPDGALSGPGSALLPMVIDGPEERLRTEPLSGPTGLTNSAFDESWGVPLDDVQVGAGLGGGHPDRRLSTLASSFCRTLQAESKFVGLQPTGSSWLDLHAGTHAPIHEEGVEDENPVRPWADDVLPSPPASSAGQAASEGRPDLAAKLDAAAQAFRDARQASEFLAGSELPSPASTFTDGLSDFRREASNTSPAPQAAPGEVESWAGLLRLVGGEPTQDATASTGSLAGTGTTNRPTPELRSREPRCGEISPADGRRRELRREHTLDGDIQPSFVAPPHDRTVSSIGADSIDSLLRPAPLSGKPPLTPSHWIAPRLPSPGAGTGTPESRQEDFDTFLDRLRSKNGATGGNLSTSSRSRSGAETGRSAGSTPVAAIGAVGGAGAGRLGASTDLWATASQRLRPPDISLSGDIPPRAGDPLAAIPGSRRRERVRTGSPVLRSAADAVLRTGSAELRPGSGPPSLRVLRQQRRPPRTAEDVTPASPASAASAVIGAPGCKLNATTSGQRAGSAEPSALEALRAERRSASRGRGPC